MSNEVGPGAVVAATFFGDHEEESAITVETDEQDSSAQDDGFPPYDSAQEHLTELLMRHDWLLKRHLARREARSPSDVLGFAAISEREVQSLLDTPARLDELKVDPQLIGLQKCIDARVEQSLRQGVRLPLIELARRFDLSRREIDFLIACLAVELDARYERVYGFLHDDMSRRLASPGVALSLYCDNVNEQMSARALLGPQAPLRYFRLLELAEDNAALPSLSRAMRVDERIVAFLLGDAALDSRIARFVTALNTDVDLLDVDARVRARRSEALGSLAQWVNALDARHKPLVYLHGAPQAGADEFVRSFAQSVNVAVLAVDAELLLDSNVDFDATLFLLVREGVLSRCAIYLRNIDRVLEPPMGATRYRTLLRCIGAMGGIVFASGEQEWCWQLPAEPVVLRIVELQPDGFAEQLLAWRVLSDDKFVASELHELISLHPLSVSAIRRVWHAAQALVVGTENAAMPTLERIKEACRAHAGAPMSTLARRIEPKHRWADLVLPSAQLEQLSAICSQAKHSSIVYGAWGFDRKLSLGRGLNVLFSGPPGTGKTMAAEVIAAELQVDILKIDLSQIVSKYIGETEKNLRQLFDQAVSANAILFFDEADALLGKRSEVKDARDRYANTEVAYLLQKMEEYPGIAILATNLRSNMDQAFVRRMRFIVDFPFPEEQDRLRIWQSIWPAEVPLAKDVDLESIARQFRLAGGSIRNIALSAAFLAAEQVEPISMRHLMRVTKQELQKMGRLVNEAEHRRHG